MTAGARHTTNGTSAEGEMTVSESQPTESIRSHYTSQHGLPTLLTADEVSKLLRTSRKAIYAMVERQQLPGIVRIGRRILVRKEALVDFLRQKSSPSLER